MADLTATPQQQAIIESREARFIVRAAAGSGKTFALVHRYLRHLLEEGCEPGQVLAFTFTKKAAAEMRGRVVGELVKRNRRDLAQAAETGPISTIHSFCERLLRENALEAGIDPEFEIFSEGDAQELQRTAVRQVLTSSDAIGSPSVLALIGELTGKITYQSTGPYDFLERTVLDLLSEYRGAGYAPDDLLPANGSPQTITTWWHAQLAATLPPLIAQQLEPKVGTPEFYPAALELCTAAMGKAKSLKPRWLTDSVVTAEARTAQDVYALSQLTAEAWQRVEHAMFSAMRMDFAALERRAVRLLTESEATRERVRQTYRHVLVDEAQDLNPTQHRLIDAIHPESLMLVGDGQQSIYGFRQADLEIFERKATQLPRLELRKNHRSQPSILRFVDLVGGAMWGDTYTPMLDPEPFDLDQPAVAPMDGVELWVGRKDTLLANTVEGIRTLIQDEGVAPKDVGVLTRQWQFASNLKRELGLLGIECRVSGGNSRFYARLEIRDLANLLRVLGDRTDDFSLLSVLRSPLVGLSLDAIAILGAGGGVFAQLDEFEGPVNGDTEKLQRFLGWFQPLLARSGWMTAWEVLSEVFAGSGYLEALAARPRRHETLANVRKLLGLAMEHPELSAPQFAERIAEIDSLRHREQDAATVDEDANAVHLLTIHSAKGLEFPVVVVPETYTKGFKPGREVEIDTRLGAFSCNLNRQPSPFFVYLRELRQSREREDSQRLLYVALTRAEKRLAVMVDAQAADDTFAGIMAKAVGMRGPFVPEGYRVRRFNTRDSEPATGNLE